MDGGTVTQSAKVKLSIGTKLIGLIALLLMGSVATLVWLSTRLFIQDNTALIQQMNSDTASGLSTQMRGVFDTLTEKMRVMGAVLREDFKRAEGQKAVLDEFFAKDKDYLAVYLYHFEKDKDGVFNLKGTSTSPEMEQHGDAQGTSAEALIRDPKAYDLLNVVRGEIEIASVKLADGSPAIALGIPFIKREGDTRFSHGLVALIRQSKFVKAFSESDIVTSFMVDRKGRLLAHPDSSLVANRESVAHLEVVKRLLEGKFNNGQTRYIDPTSKAAKLGAYKIVGFGGLGVVAEVAEEKAFEAARRVTYRSILVALAVLSLSFMAGYLYSGTITWPIKQLVEASHRIAQGDFNINLKPKSKDEVAALALAFNDMAKGLEERDKVKETFNKFHSKEIAEKLLSGEVKLGGDRIEATVFFSDVRGFTNMSESREPEQVVEMLNEYMSRMVSIITAHGGVVDKYIGDAIMGLWGVPIAGKDDTLRAVKACIAMREELAKLNDLRISRGQPALKIGMGLNRGQVIAGNIGSNEKMEYTVIGDTVNLASRVESMTKEYGTDCLIPKSVYDVVKDKFIFEATTSAKVKGKSEAIELYNLRGYIDEKGEKVIVETPYSSYKSEKSDKSVHDDDKKKAA